MRISPLLSLDAARRRIRGIGTPTTRETILAALHARLSALPATAPRGEVLPERVPIEGLLIVAEAGGRCAPFSRDGHLVPGDAVRAVAPGAWTVLGQCWTAEGYSRAAPMPSQGGGRPDGDPNHRLDPTQFIKGGSLI